VTTLRASRTQEALDVVRDAPSLLAGIEAFDAVALAARQDGAAAGPVLQRAVDDPADDLAAIAAVHAAAGGARTATPLVLPLLSSPVPFLREHAAWALGFGPPLPAAVPRLTGLAAAGGFTGTLAAATLEAWDTSPRGRPDGRGGAAPRAEGLTVAQLFLHADIDGSLQSAGKGDTGGIATLLVHLGDALLADPRVSRVLTLSRSHHGQDRTPADLRAPGHHYVGVPLPGPVRHSADTWHLRDAVRRGLREVLTAAGPVDVLHLRMADVGSWAAAEVAAELGIPTVLTLAPDPHALVAAREAAGALTRATFGPVDHAEHLVFRVRLLRDLAARSAHLVALPRPDLERDLRDLLHLDPEAEAQRLSVVPEGIDLGPLRRAARAVTTTGRDVIPPASREDLAELDAVLCALPPARRGLPLLVSVGRLHRVKGMATLVEAWARDPRCARRCNLLLVGGDLADPTDDEEEQLSLVAETVPPGEEAGRGLLLAGHRPNETVATWLAAVRHGRPGLAAAGGVYVSASLKEEFGIAILEAMASGLVVVAPRVGGPATYVEHGVTGLLVDTTSQDALAEAVVTALDLAVAPGAAARAEHARTMVAERFGIGTMAASLAGIYDRVHREAPS
jgi:glycosyltransferase involved in cell wall biosynthesis